MSNSIIHPNGIKMAAQTQQKIRKTSEDVILAGSTWAAIWFMAWPIVLDFGAVSAAAFADLVVAGRLGSESQAAMGVGGQVWYLMIILVNAIPVGTLAIISRFWGERNVEQATEVARQSIIFAVLFGAATTVVGLIACKPLLVFLGATASVKAVAWQWLRLLILAQIPLTVRWILKYILRAKGDARLPMFSSLVFTALVIFLDIFLCLGAPHLGMAGIGYSWAIAGCVELAILAYFVKKSELGGCLSWQALGQHGISFSWIRKILAIGLPTCLQDMVWLFANFTLLIILAHTKDPTACQASWAIGVRLEETLATLPMYALARAASTIVGQSLGARKPERAITTARQVAIIGFAYCSLIALVMYVFAKPIAEMMTTSHAAVVYAVQYLQIVGLAQPFIALSITLFGAMQGAGYTRLPMIAEVATLLLLRLPLAWLLTIHFGLGPTGTWLAMSISVTTLSLLALWQFKKGSWELQRV
jgi:putative MATE family efflux protein